MEFQRETLLNTLNALSPALGRSSVTPVVSHFWFDKKFVYASDSGLGIRQKFPTDLACGLPGKPLLDLLNTSTLPKVSLEPGKAGSIILKMGRSRINLAAMEAEIDTVWKFPVAAPKDGAHIVLSERIREAVKQIACARHDKPAKTIHHGVIVDPGKHGINLYVTDSISIAHALVNERAASDLPRFLIPWELLSVALAMTAPGAKLHILDNCLIIESSDVLLCSQVLDMTDTPDVGAALVKTRSYTDGAEAVGLPKGLQMILDRAMILAGKEDPFITLAAEDTTLTLAGKYALGSVNHDLTLPKKASRTSGCFRAGMISRGLGFADSFIFNNRALVLQGGESFVYAMAAAPEQRNA